jgi:hypothetical protein
MISPAVISRMGFPSIRTFCRRSVRAASAAGVATLYRTAA